jgi:uncharacterized membrane protein YozB (DUF420 family)
MAEFRKLGRVEFLNSIIAIYAGMFLIATLVVIWKGDNKIFSRDCIWFNAVIACIYLILRHKQYQQKRERKKKKARQPRKKKRGSKKRKK